MVRITILYPRTEGARFDMDYYLQKHMPLSIGYLRTHPGFRAVSVERGVAGGEPGSHAPFVAVCQFLFETVDDFVAAFTPHAAELQADIPAYTDISPVIQISAVELADAQAAGGSVAT